ncbi:MAG: hypothetical protein ACK5MU_01540 [Candidatus Saccharimonadales bacterium]
MKKYFAVCLILLEVLLSGVVWAENASDDMNMSPQLMISAVNAGYTEGETKQNYDFVEIYNTTGEPVSLDSVRLEYLNSAGNAGGEISFGVGMELNAEYLVLGFAKSPQYVGSDANYLYGFGGASGLASTAGVLRLYDSDALLDEICWGNAVCSDGYSKFGTTYETNTSLRRCIVDGLVEKCEDGRGLEMTKYYPMISDAALYYKEAEMPEPQCAGLIFSEVYSYFETEAAEQFVEIHNPTDDIVTLAGCMIEYKGKNYEMSGEVFSGEYYVYQNLEMKLTKNPSSSNEILLIDVDGTEVASVEYYYGQKRGTSFAWFEDGWKQTYARTYGVENIWQEFRSCAVGKIINP